MSALIPAIVTAIITGICSIIVAIITANNIGTKVLNEMKTAQAVTETKIQELTREVREHNGFARRMPVVEEKIENIDRRVNNLEKKGA